MSSSIDEKCREEAGRRGGSLVLSGSDKGSPGVESYSDIEPNHAGNPWSREFVGDTHW